MITVQRNFKPIGQGAFYEENIYVAKENQELENEDCRRACRMYY